jgi:hypothetical protein
MNFEVAAPQGVATFCVFAIVCIRMIAHAIGSMAQRDRASIFE